MSLSSATPLPTALATVTRPLRIAETRPATPEHRVAAEVHRVEELVVDPPVDDVDRAVARGRAHPHLAADADQVTALDELDAHHPGQQGVLEVGAS